MFVRVQNAYIHTYIHALNSQATVLFALSADVYANHTCIHTYKHTYTNTLYSQVTVPFVLSTGVGCSKAVKAAEGFGILACASVWPIITGTYMCLCMYVCVCVCVCLYVSKLPRDSACASVWPIITGTYSLI
jgi:hypothetical protein